MLEKITYRNHINEVVEIGQNGIFVNESDLHDFSWSVTKRNDRISAFNKGVVKKTIPLQIVCNSEEEGIQIRNRIFEVMEKDVLAMKHGRIIIGNYYLRCFVTASKKSDYLRSKGLLTVKLTVQTDFPEWIRETTTVFNTKSGNISGLLDFPYDYPYDFKNELASGSINNTGFVASHFKMIIYGFVTNPTLYIGGHEYTVNVEVGTGEYLTIDSMNKTIVLTKYNGEQVNCFNARNKESYIFEKIPAGSSVIMTSGQISFDITLLEERSEPKWT